MEGGYGFLPVSFQRNCSVIWPQARVSQLRVAEQIRLHPFLIQPPQWHSASCSLLVIAGALKLWVFSITYLGNSFEVLLFLAFLTLQFSRTSFRLIELSSNVRLKNKIWEPKS